MTDRQRESWQIVQKRGLLRYLVVQGLLVIGPGFASLSLLIRYCLFSPLFNLHWNGFPNELYRAAFDTVFFGLFSASWTWRTNNKRFNKSNEPTPRTEG